MVVIGMGTGSERVGLITHGDVQPVDPAKWKKSPFELDRTSEPGRLLGRGTEDDKSSIATAMLAMKAIHDLQLPLKKRLELYVYMAEESDWDPLTEFLKTHVPPQINLTFDAEYPVVIAEKGWGALRLGFPREGGPRTRAGDCRVQGRLFRQPDSGRRQRRDRQRHIGPGGGRARLGRRPAGHAV
ncbi:M20/M25/M40 family metallo-hydrolase [Massilia sp. B-10]|nr:M20/M25/M40 family metallo-hydrolase [Massilia sp. B-10]